MAMKLNSATADAALSAVGTLLNGGSIVIYSGTVPTTADTSLSGNTTLATLTFSATAFASPVADNVVATSRRIIANTITADSSADATNTATFFRAYRSAGNGGASVYQGAVGATGSGAELELNNASITAAGSVTVTSLKIVLPTE